MKRPLVLAVLCLFPMLCPAQDLFKIQQVADGVYAAIVAPGYNCNSAIILLDDGVLVVDAQASPSASRALIAQIKKITDKPVKYVVNTHFHWDHYQGNQAYYDAFPGVKIISSEATRQAIEKKGIPRLEHDVVVRPAQIEKLKADMDRATDAKQKDALRTDLTRAQDYFADIRNLDPAANLPNTTFDRSLILHQKSKTIEMLWLGRGHTEGDAFVYIPEQKIIATGDELHDMAPYMPDSYPYDWIQTLDAVEKLDIDYIIGGHGEVLKGKQRIDVWKNYLADIMALASQSWAQGEDHQQAVDRISGILQAKFNPQFGSPPSIGFVKLNVEKALDVVMMH